jgi:hypothetical protein
MKMYVKRLDSNSPSSTILDSLKKVQTDDGLHDILGDPPVLGEKIDTKELAKAIIRDRVDDKGFIVNELTPEFEDLTKESCLVCRGYYY